MGTLETRSTNTTTTLPLIIKIKDPFSKGDDATLPGIHMAYA
jgi:hypothetical protein